MDKKDFVIGLMLACLKGIASLLASNYAYNAHRLHILEVVTRVENELKNV